MNVTLEHLLSADESILAVCLMDPDFNIVEAASRPTIGKFDIPDKVQKSAGAFAAMMVGVAGLVEGAFGETRSIVVEHTGAKTLLLRLPGNWFAGMVLARSANADYIAARVGSALEKQGIEEYA
ncbi:MAG: hypothetical protein ABI347_01240 [Nitrososphaera sp.]|jgi:hypothetical protein